MMTVDDPKRTRLGLAWVCEGSLVIANLMLSKPMWREVRENDGKQHLLHSSAWNPEIQWATSDLGHSATTDHPVV